MDEIGRENRATKGGSKRRKRRGLAVKLESVNESEEEADLGNRPPSRPSLCILAEWAASCVRQLCDATPLCAMLPGRRSRATRRNGEVERLHARACGQYFRWAASYTGRTPVAGRSRDPMCESDGAFARDERDVCRWGRDEEGKAIAAASLRVSEREGTYEYRVQLKNLEGVGRLQSKIKMVSVYRLSRKMRERKNVSLGLGSQARTPHYATKRRKRGNTPASSVLIVKSVRRDRRKTRLVPDSHIFLSFALFFVFLPPPFLSPLLSPLYLPLLAIAR